MSFFKFSKPQQQPWSPAGAAGASSGFEEKKDSPAPATVDRTAEAPVPANAPAPMPAETATPGTAPLAQQAGFGGQRSGARPSQALAALRSQFGAPGGRPRRDRPFPRRPPPPRIFHESDPVPSVELPEGGTIVVRNCSTKRVLQLLIGEFGGRAEDISGRYFIPAAQDLPRIHDFAKKNGFFVKESLVGKILMLDVMVDRSIRGPGGRQFDDGDDDRE